MLLDTSKDVSEQYTTDKMSKAVKASIPVKLEMLVNEISITPSKEFASLTCISLSPLVLIAVLLTK